MLLKIFYFLMFFPALVTLAIASRRPALLIWNFAWYLVFADVGLRAFGSVWAALPGLYFAVQYAFRAFQDRPRPQFDFRVFGAGGARPRAEPSPASEGEVIDAEFKREEEGPLAKVISFKRDDRH